MLYLARGLAQAAIRGRACASKPCPYATAALNSDISHVQGSNAALEPAALARSEQPLGLDKKFFIETYGCQMNVSDSEIVASILQASSFSSATSAADADVVLLNTCAIRESAESRIWGRLGSHQALKQAARKENRSPPVIGVLGCMAERLKDRLFARGMADIVVGPDAYRDLPRLIQAVQDGSTSAMNVQLSLEETYADIVPARRAGAVSAFVSIMRGCNNMCTFCIVPYTRGRERSRALQSVVDEVRALRDEGVREVTLLGQNVNSYADQPPRQHESGGDDSGRPRRAEGEAEGSGETSTSLQGADQARKGVSSWPYARGFRSVYVPRREGAYVFSDLLAAVAAVDPELRVRFTSPHPKDFGDDVLQVIAAHANICRALHMPAQSGSSSVLSRMRRGYDRHAYDALLEYTRNALPGVALSTDIITGFCGETEEEHGDTLSLLASTCFDAAFIFAYSQRDRTHAARHLADDVLPEVKSRRLQEALAVYTRGQEMRCAQEVGRVHLVLLEGPSRKHPDFLVGKTCSMKKVVLPAGLVPASLAGAAAAPGLGPLVGPCAGDYVAVLVEGWQHSTLQATPLARTSTTEFVAQLGSTLPGNEDSAAFVSRLKSLQGGTVGGPYAYAEPTQVSMAVVG